MHLHVNEMKPVKIELNIAQKHLWAFAMLVLLIAGTVFVYAIVSSVTNNPNPGHNFENLYLGPLSINDAASPQVSVAGDLTATGKITGTQLCIGANCKSTWPGDLAGGSANYLAKWTGASTVGTSIIFDDGANVGIGLGVNPPTAKLDVGTGTVKAGMTIVDDICVKGGYCLGSVTKEIMSVNNSNERWASYGDYNAWEMQCPITHAMIVMGTVDNTPYIRCRKNLPAPLDTETGVYSPYANISEQADWGVGSVANELSCPKPYYISGISQVRLAGNVQRGITCTNGNSPLTNIIADPGPPYNKSWGNASTWDLDCDAGQVAVGMGQRRSGQFNFMYFPYLLCATPTPS